MSSSSKTTRFSLLSLLALHGLVTAWLLPLASAQSFAVPEGMLAFFAQAACPSGWARQEVPGRVLVDQGNFIGVRADGVQEAKIFSVGEMGGEMTHKLKVAEMANHNHVNGVHDQLLKVDGIDTTNGYGLDNAHGLLDEPNLHYSAPMQSQGGDQSHNNMAPYFVATLCRKLADSPTPTAPPSASASTSPSEFLQLSASQSAAPSASGSPTQWSVGVDVTTTPNTGTSRSARDHRTETRIDLLKQRVAALEARVYDMMQQQQQPQQQQQQHSTSSSGTTSLMIICLLGLISGLLGAAVFVMVRTKTTHAQVHHPSRNPGIIELPEARATASYTQFSDDSLKV